MKSYQKYNFILISTALLGSFLYYLFANSYIELSSSGYLNTNFQNYIKSHFNVYSESNQTNSIQNLSSYTQTKQIRITEPIQIFSSHKQIQLNRTNNSICPLIPPNLGNLKFIIFIKNLKATQY